MTTTERSTSAANGRRIVVQKYGGTSVANTERIRLAAERAKQTHDRGDSLVVVVSAMAGETNRLLALGSEVCPDPEDRELDVLVSTGEQVTSALLALALHKLGVPAVSLQGHQIRIATDSSYGRARIKSIDCSRIEMAFALGQVVVVPGFQGVDDGHNITTLGRGGSDTTAVAIAAALEADVCEIFTDVDGVYTADPRICPDAVKLERISYDEMLELAGVGAKVLQIRSVEMASRYAVPVNVRSSFNDNEGTWVVPVEQQMEQVLVSGVACDKNQAKVTLQGVPDRPGLAAAILRPIAEAGICIDMIVQNVSREDGRTSLTFTCDATDLSAVAKQVDRIVADLGLAGSVSGDHVAKISVAGLGMRNHAGVAAKMFAVLAGEGINIQLISTSEIKISVVVDVDDVDRAVRALHAAFITSENVAAPARTA
jgi:aspartate kinase